MKEKSPRKTVRGKKPTAHTTPPVKKHAHLVGLAFEEADGHKRITKGEKFTLLGGSQTTHEAMTESVVKTFETLKRKGRTLETADPREVADLLQKHYPRT